MEPVVDGSSQSRCGGVPGPPAEPRHQTRAGVVRRSRRAPGAAGVLCRHPHARVATAWDHTRDEQRRHAVGWPGDTRPPSATHPGRRRRAPVPTSAGRGCHPTWPRRAKIGAAQRPWAPVGAGSSACQHRVAGRGRARRAAGSCPGFALKGQREERRQIPPQARIPRAQSIDFPAFFQPVPFGTDRDRGTEFGRIKLMQQGRQAWFLGPHRIKQGLPGRNQFERTRARDCRRTWR